MVRLSIGIFKARSTELQKCCYKLNWLHSLVLHSVQVAQMKLGLTIWLQIMFTFGKLFSPAQKPPVLCPLIDRGNPQTKVLSAKLH